MTAVDPDRIRRRRGYRRKAAVSVLVSGGLLALILSRLDPGSLTAALGAVDGPGFLATFALFGAALVCVGLRWRLALGLAAIPLPPAVQARAVLGGHCFNMLLFGAAGGDVAKAAAYSRWYGAPIHDLLVSAIMDRSFAALGAALFAALTALLMILGRVALPSDLGAGAPDIGPWALGAAAVGLLVLGLVYRFRHSPFLRNLGRSLRSTLRAAADRPGTLALGALLGLAGQVLMSLSMGVALWSITDSTVSWLAILWTFPLITAVAALPTSFGGAGVREAVAILLLARYGIPAADLVAAGLAYLAVQVVWAAVGAGVLAWEERRFTARG